ncbi:hypothetical protein JKA73_15615 [Myxococcus xanthus]|nr:hypothetical protein JKA73_15615 [Myxococcus xanthus]
MKLVLEEGKSVAEVARDLNLTETAFHQFQISALWSTENSRRLLGMHCSYQRVGAVASTH